MSIESKIENLEKQIKTLETNLKQYIEVSTISIIEEQRKCECNKEILQALKNDKDKQKEDINPLKDPNPKIKPIFTNWQTTSKMDNPFLHGRQSYQ